MAQAACEHGLRVRREPRPLNTPVDQQVRLPPSPPPHSVSTPVTAMSTLRPSDISFEDFLCRMHNMERFLVDNSINVFQVTGSRSMATWTNMLPIESARGIVGRTGLKADSEGLQGGPSSSPTLVSHSPQFNPLLVRLAVEISSVKQPTCTRFEAFCADMCRELERHISDPERYECHFNPARSKKKTCCICFDRCTYKPWPFRNSAGS